MNYKAGRVTRRQKHNTSHRGFWLRHWPKWWDVVEHTRPRRREESARLNKVLRGVVDPDDLPWPLEKKPHQYYW
jgi:hypothetical protein